MGRGGQVEFWEYCPFCGRGLAFFEEQTRTVKNCPVCQAPICFEEYIDPKAEKIGYRILPAVTGESFQKDGFVVENGTLVRYEGTEDTIVTPAGVVAIGEDAFKAQKRLKKVVVSEGVLYIGKSAFEGCESVREFSLPQSLRTIGHCAFLACRRVEKVELPSGLRAVGYSIFQYCDNLLEVDLPMDLVFAAGSPYRFCRRLTRATVPHCVEETTQWFSDSENVKHVVYGRKVRWLDFVHLPKLQEARFCNPEGWQVFSNGEAVPSEEMANPKKAALVLKKYTKQHRSLYIPSDPFAKTPYWLKLYDEE